MMGSKDKPLSTIVPNARALADALSEATDSQANSDALKLVDAASKADTAEQLAELIRHEIDGWADRDD
jgi:hypothetical protein